MGDTNYISTVVKILENPRHIILPKNVALTTFRVQLPQIRKIKLVTLVFWGNLARDVNNYYSMNDYIMIEGYFSLREKQNNKRVEIAVVKIYPFLMSYDRLNDEYEG